MNFLFAISFAQRTQPNETLLILALERRLLSILELKSHVSQSLNKAIKALWFLFQNSINSFTEIVTLGTLLGINSSFLTLPIRLGSNNGQTVFQANHIAEPLHRKTGKEEVFEFPCSIQRGRIINDMVVNMGFVDVGCNDESVFSLCPSHRCFIADLVRFFRSDFSRLKRLAYLVCDDIVLLLSAGNMLILPFGKQKFLICCLWITLIGADKFAIIGFCGVL